jgi:predicted component of type VI protein secretion system
MNRLSCNLHESHPLAVAVRIEDHQGVVSEVALIAPTTVVIGRHSECGLRLDGDRVSRCHATLRLGVQGFLLEDTSANGTEVAPAHLVHRAQRELPYGSLLRIGTFELRVGHGGPTPPTIAVSGSRVIPT